ncbi:MAG: diguanylate cyclase [candidate division Zixibacteria bacterium]|nr:diguanylate cyclase [candidate division Zixibacteria bacterium]
MDRETEILDELYKERDNFLSRVQQELKRAQRYLSFISFIKIDTTRFNKTGDIEIPNLNSETSRRMKTLLRKTIRQTDIISGFNDGKICILLVETQKDGADIVKNRIQESIKYFLHEMFDSPMNWRVDIRLGSFPDNKSTPNSFYDSIRTSL